MEPRVGPRAIGNGMSARVYVFCLLCSFSALNVFILFSSYNASGFTAVAELGSEPRIDRSDYLRVSALSKEIEQMKKQHSKFRDETNDKLHALEDKINGTFATRNRILKVHLWDDSTLPNGYREKKLYSVEGFTNHPRTQLVLSADDADLIVWATVRGNTEAEVPPSDYSNVVVIDYADGCSAHQKRNELKHMIGYFKRSFVSRNEHSLYEGNCTSEPVEGGVFPFAYSGLKAIVNKDIEKERSTLITNVLRTEYDHNTVRARIVNWTSAFIERNDLKHNSLVGEKGHGYSSSDFDDAYLLHLADSKIIVTCNPWRWEGDFRLWEALLSGALVFVDIMAIPQWMPNPFVHKKHLIYYDTTNQTEFDSLLRYYIDHEDEAKAIGKAGYNFVLEHHMAEDRVSYILDKIEDRIVFDG